jgi:pyrroline-5-carboxylate reductase
LDGRLAVLGAGKIGGILLRAFLEQKLVQHRRVHATVRHAEKARALAKELGIEVSTDNRAAVRDADIVLLAVKPQAVREVLEEIKPEMKPGKLIVSVVASVSTQDISTLLAAQTMMGAARMVLDTGDHPALLKDAVTTPAGSTMDGILELEDGKVRVTLIKAVMKATQRAKELILES